MEIQQTFTHDRNMIDLTTVTLYTVTIVKCLGSAKRRGWCSVLHKEVYPGKCCGERGRMVRALHPRSRGWSSIPSELVMRKSLGQALNPHRLCLRTSNGYQVERKLILFEWQEPQKMWYILHREMSARSRVIKFQHLRVIYVNC